jgi:hypothetical protein
MSGKVRIVAANGSLVSLQRAGLYILVQSVDAQIARRLHEHQTGA